MPFWGVDGFCGGFNSLAAHILCGEKFGGLGSLKNLIETTPNARTQLHNQDLFAMVAKVHNPVPYATKSDNMSTRTYTMSCHRRTPS